MARTIAPHGNQIPEALNIPDNPIDVRPIQALAKQKLDVANTNFTLYAEGIIKTQTADAFNKFKNDPIQLSNALAKIPESLSDLPEEVQNKFKPRFYLESVGLVQKAEQNRLAELEKQNIERTQDEIATIQPLLAQNYEVVLDNHIQPLETKNQIANDSYVMELQRLKELSELKNANGKYVFSATQRKQLANPADMQLNAFKSYIDQKIINDDDELTATKDYYTKFILAPERFMKENYTDRNTYDAMKKYAESAIKRAGGDIKKARFNQSVSEAMALTVANSPAKLQYLKESGQINKSLIKSLENTTVKFDNLDYSKPVTPLGIFDAIDIASTSQLQAGTRESDRIDTLVSTIRAQDALAEYADTYGFSKKDTDMMRQAITLKAVDVNFANFMNKIENIRSRFGNDTGISPIERVRSTPNNRLYNAPLRTFGDWSNFDRMNIADRNKYTMINNVMAQAIDAAIMATRTGNQDQLPIIFEKANREITKLNNPYVNWAAYEQNPDALLQVNGSTGRIRGFNDDGTFIWEEAE